jgi:predicted nucleotidyltransferase
MLKTNYNLLAVDGLQKPLEEISTACQSLGINFFIVGAIARNIWLTANDEKPSGTKDIDFGVCVPDDETFNKLKGILTEKHRYQTSKENAFCLISPEGIHVDLLPFGEIEKDGEVEIEGVGLTTIKLDGFKEVFENGAVDVKIGKEIYKSSSIAGIVILKFIAYDDRPDRRIKDIEDIDSICSNYPTIEDENIWANHFDLYEDHLEHFDVGMIVLGREINRMIGTNENLRKRIVNILNRGIALESSIISIMIKDPERETAEDKRGILKNILRGITESE